MVLSKPASAVDEREGWKDWGFMAGKGRGDGEWRMEGLSGFKGFKLTFVSRFRFDETTGVKL